MSFRTYLEQLEKQGEVVIVDKPTSKIYQMAAILRGIEPRPALFKHVRESEFRVAGNLFPGKREFADYFELANDKIIPTLTQAIERRSEPLVINEAPCQEVIITNPDLDALPILRHFPDDGGNYITSGVVVAKHPEYGQNLDFHRCMQFSMREMAMRVVKGRHFETFLQELGEVDVAVCIGVAPNILAAAATSVEIGIDELQIANALELFQVVKAKTVDLNIPAESEFVLEGRVFRDRRHIEGPFVDLTETQDVTRQEPVFEVKLITHRQDAIWQALLPGGLEHKLLMGMPREPTIFKEVNQVVHCLDVNVSPGGCSWLHAIVKIDKQSPDDGKKAIEAAFEGHHSCKHVFVVDKDIDIYDPRQVEWAMATRFQGDVDLVVKQNERGSSLDPSAALETHLTTKIGFDLTKPLGEQGKHFEKVTYPQVALDNFVDL